jgi:HEAT repeat protein
MTTAEIACPGTLPQHHIPHLLESRERTLRFTGVRLARLLRDASAQHSVSVLAADPEEDVYVRLEASSYLTSVCGVQAAGLFGPFLVSTDPQTQLEAVIALGEAATDEAVGLLVSVLDDAGLPYFLRSAAAWSLSRVNNPNAFARLVRAFADVHPDIRYEALEGVSMIGGPAVPLLLEGLRGTDDAIAAGCAESLRQQRTLPDDVVASVIAELRGNSPSAWTTWLVGHLPRERVATAIADLQRAAPALHYAVSVLWSFVESWIARRWELLPLPSPEAHGDV